MIVQLAELVNVEGYSDWIRLVADFTSKSLQSWQVRVPFWCFFVCFRSGSGGSSFEFREKLILFFCPCQWASSSVYYLLGLWSRLVTSVPYLKGEAPSLLDEFVPRITEGFITSRLDSVQVTRRKINSSRFLQFYLLYLSNSACYFFFLFFQAGFPDDLSENPLDNVELLQDQLECFPYLCKFQVIYVDITCFVLGVASVHGFCQIVKFYLHLVNAV